MKRKMSALGKASGCVSSLAVIATLVASQHVAAHGYLNDPPSRAFACQKGLNNDCGQAQYEPQSVGETTKGFPNGGVADGKIASGGIALFSPLDIQSASRWYKTEITDRTINFDWYYRATHPATKYEYFITRNGWNANQALTRASFDLTPFCSVDAGGRLPTDQPQGSDGPAREKHPCEIPADKSGYHVILGMWTVADTGGAFHNVVDVNIVAEEQAPDGWKTVGNITPTQALLAGDKVKARAMTGEGESAEYSTEITIADSEDGKPENWSFKLAEQINRSQTLVRAGVRGEDGAIEPIKGVNQLFAKAESGVNRYELDVLMQEDADASMRISAIGTNFELKEGRLAMPFPVLTNRKMDIKAELFDAANNPVPVGTLTQLVEAGSTWLNMDVHSEPGIHQLKLIGVTVDGRTTRQDLASVELGGEGGSQDYDFKYPQGIASYQPGTKVLSRDGNVYECKPLPVGDWCKIDSHHYVPGVGSSWTDAWIAK
ncbi:MULTISPECIES: lytic polysaccharide monooxygenase [unclassified Pseudomonas]|uniref:lytic polysaccharide monooxygenase n=1 Tax=unclassified Pseudomonas TaxID=196821 RepID=UPI00128DFCE3|nr:MULTISPECIES: lytic polysaccharide monooxygenase [unclassified Pseudomonas]MPQ66989.1 multidrug transporter [Pseudomonas sp. MWU12-2323]